MNHPMHAPQDALAPLAPAGLTLMEPLGLTSRASGDSGPTPGFSTWLVRGLADLNTQLAGAELALQQLAAGQTAELHTVMLQLEQARLAMQVANQVRTRVVDAYQEVMRMQV